MHTAPPITITTVVSEFLGSAPSLEEIIAFRLPDPLEARALELLSFNRERELSVEERDELDEFTRIGRLMNRIKLQARLKLGGYYC